MDCGQVEPQVHRLACWSRSSVGKRSRGSWIDSFHGAPALFWRIIIVEKWLFGLPTLGCVYASCWITRFVSQSAFSIFLASKTLSTTTLNSSALIFATRSCTFFLTSASVLLSFRVTERQGYVTLGGCCQFHCDVVSLLRCSYVFRIESALYASEGIDIGTGWYPANVLGLSEASIKGSWALPPKLCCVVLQVMPSEDFLVPLIAIDNVLRCLRHRCKGKNLVC